jgi:hypothetical protein
MSELISVIVTALVTGTGLYFTNKKNEADKTSQLTEAILSNLSEVYNLNTDTISTFKQEIKDLKSENERLQISIKTLEASNESFILDKNLFYLTTNKFIDVKNQVTIPTVIFDYHGVVTDSNKAFLDKYPTFTNFMFTSKSVIENLVNGKSTFVVHREQQFVCVSCLYKENTIWSVVLDDKDLANIALIK